MKSLFICLALAATLPLAAQEYLPSYGLEPTRSELIVYPSAQEASQANGQDNKYFTRLTAWTQQATSFKCDITVPFDWINRQVLFHLDWASADYEVLVNGTPIAYDSDANAPAEFNLTKHTQEGRNTLEVKLKNPSPVKPLESWKESPKAAIGPAWLLSQPTLRLRDVIVTTRQNDAARDVAMAEIGLVMKSEALNARTSRVHYELLTPQGQRAAFGYKDITLAMRGEDTIRFLATVPDTLLWSPERPQLFTLRTRTQHDGRFEEYVELPLGLRSIAMKGDQLLLNGSATPLRAHELSPSASAAEIEALHRQGFNTLLLAPGPVAPGLYDTCDTMGIFVVPQAPIDTHKSGDSRRKGGNPSNVPSWLGAFTERTENSYHASKRHPSVIAFSLATKSSNGINLYESYLDMKKMHDQRPFIYRDNAGEWNSDPLKMN